MPTKKLYQVVLRDQSHAYLLREHLVKNGACGEGLAFFDKLAKQQGRKTRVRIDAELRLRLCVDHPTYVEWAQDSGLLLPVYARGITFNRVLAENAHLEYATLRSCDFVEAVLEGACLNSADIQNSSFVKANLKGAGIREARASYVNFTDADMRNVSFYESMLRFARFDRANAEGASFTGADLRSAVFDNANLRGASFMGAILTGAVFTGARRDADDSRIPGWIVDRGRMVRE